MILLGKGWLSKPESQENGYSAWKRFWHNVGFVITFKWARKSKLE